MNEAFGPEKLCNTIAEHQVKSTLGPLLRLQKQVMFQEDRVEKPSNGMADPWKRHFQDEKERMS